MTPTSNATAVIMATLMMLGLGTGMGVVIDAAGLQSSLPPISRLITADLDALAGSGLRTRAYTFNTLLADKMTDDRLRSYPHWLASRNLSNEASDESVQALIEAVRGRYEPARRWYPPPRGATSGCAGRTTVRTPSRSGWSGSAASRGRRRTHSSSMTRTSPPVPKRR